MNAPEPDLRDRITQNPSVMVGKPVVGGTRIPIETVLGHLAGTPDFRGLFEAYPELTIEDVQAVLLYAHDLQRARGQRAARKVLRSLSRPA